MYFSICMAQWVKILPTVQETQSQSLDQEDPLEKEMAPSPVFLLGNPMERGACCAPVQRVVHD